MWQSPEEPDRSAESVQIVLSSVQFQWLSKQCEFLGVTKQELIANALEEWICRNRPITTRLDPSVVISQALGEFMQRHRNEFLPIGG
jgi:hypothetical protein